MAVKTPETQEEQDSAYNPAQDLYDREFNGIANNFDKEADSSDEEKNIDSAREKLSDEEKNPDEIPYENTGKSPEGGGRFNFKLGGLKKKGPILSIILLVAGIGLGGSTLFGPALLIVQMKEVFSNYGGSASRAAPLRYQQRLVYMLGDKDKKTERACASNSSSIRCKRGTMSEKDRANYERNGFKFNNAKEVGGRTIIKEVEFPDGHKVSSGKEFNRYVKANPEMASKALAAHNPRTLIFNGGRFSKFVLKKFGLDKSKVQLSGDDDKERRESLNTHVKADGSDSESKIKGDLDSKKGKVSDKIGHGAAAVVGTACAMFNMARITIASVKVANSLRFVGFAMLFLKAADQIKDQGSVDPGTIATLGGILTSYATTGDKKGLTATDSQGYKVAAYGGEGALKSWTKSYLLGNNKLVSGVDSLLSTIYSVPGGKQSIKTACKSTSGVGGQATSAALCTISAATGGTFAFPGLGTVIGGIVGAVSCFAIGEALALAAGPIVGAIVGKLLPLAIDALKEAPLSADIGGVDAGNAIAVGAGVMLATTSLSRGMKPANKQDVANFKTATAESENQYENIARYDARKEPFNIYNQYSFLGSLVRSSGVSYASNGSLFSSIQNVGTLMSSAVRVTPSALAISSMPLPITDEDLSHCPDQDLVDIGVDCDRVGQMQLTMSNAELTMVDEDNLRYMIGSYVDESGNIIDDESDYAKFVKNCTEQREYLMGSDGEPIEDSDEWTSGEKCVENSDMLSNFRVYYFGQGDTEDSDYDTGTASSAPAGGGSQFRIASFNMRGACHTLADTSKQCNKNGNADTSTHRDYTERMEYSYNTIVNNRYDVIGFQEFQGSQQNLLKSKLPNFEFSSNSADNAIGWDKTKFNKVSDGLMPNLKYDGNNKLIAPYVKLEDSNTHQQFYVLNTHDPANVFDNAANNREDNVNQHVKFIQGLKNENIPILFTGDFNSPYSAKPSSNSYCGITQAAYNTSNVAALSDAYDVSTNRKVKCPNANAQINGHSVSIDHIFVSDDIQISGISSVDKGYTSNGSDHPTVAADIIIPSSDPDSNTSEIIDGPSKDGWVWPVPSVKTLGILGYGEQGSKGIHKGIDIGISGGGALGKPVVAAHDGVVNWVDTSDDDGCGNYISITATGTKYYAAYQHLAKKGILVHKGDTVKAGQVIAQIGTQGGSSCGSSGFYHLHFSIESSPSMVSVYADKFPHGTIDPLSVLPRPK